MKYSNLSKYEHFLNTRHNIIMDLSDSIHHINVQCRTRRMVKNIHGGKRMLIKYINDNTSTEIFSMDTSDLSGIILLLKESNSVILINDTTYYYSYLVLNNYQDSGTWKQEVVLHLIT